MNRLRNRLILIFLAATLVPLGATMWYTTSLLKLTSSLTVSQWFTPTDQQADDLNDADFGSGGAAILADLPAGSPVTHLLLCGGKDETLYVLNRDKLGSLGDSNAVQPISFGHGIFATGAYWNNHFYLAGNGGPVSDYLLDPTVPKLNLVTSSTNIYPWPGSSPAGPRHRNWCSTPRHPWPW